MRKTAEELALAKREQTGAFYSSVQAQSASETDAKFAPISLRHYRVFVPNYNNQIICSEQNDDENAQEDDIADEEAVDDQEAVDEQQAAQVLLASQLQALQALKEQHRQLLAERERLELLRV